MHSAQQLRAQTAGAPVSGQEQRYMRSEGTEGAIKINEMNRDDCKIASF